jgi:hypothetical protein
LCVEQRIQAERAPHDSLHFCWGRDLDGDGHIDPGEGGAEAVEAAVHMYCQPPLSSPPALVELEGEGQGEGLRHSTQVRGAAAPLALRACRRPPPSLPTPNSHQIRSKFTPNSPPPRACRGAEAPAPQLPSLLPGRVVPPPVHRNLLAGAGAGGGAETESGDESDASDASAVSASLL